MQNEKIKKETRKNKNKPLNERVIYAILRQEGYTYGQTSHIKREEIQSQGALDTLVNELKNDDTTRYEVIRDSDGVARTVVEISNHNASGGVDQIVNILYTSVSTAGDLIKLLKTCDVNALHEYLKKRHEQKEKEWKQKEENWKNTLKYRFRKAFGENAVRD